NKSGQRFRRQQWYVAVGDHDGAGDRADGFQSLLYSTPSAWDFVLVSNHQVRVVFKEMINHPISLMTYNSHKMFGIQTAGCIECMSDERTATHRVQNFR